MSGISTPSTSHSTTCMTEAKFPGCLGTHRSRPISLLSLIHVARHDVSMQVVGQPARDLARHFVQRWNHLLRIKNHTRAMPFLLPPPEFKPGELSHMGLTGTCELQICRSAGPWSMGTPDRIECSIQNAYLKGACCLRSLLYTSHALAIAIQLSEHFVYIENQFFITS